VPTQEEEERLEGKKRFFSALNRLNRFEVREGKLEFRGTDRESNRPIFEQKRVDIYLGVDLVLLAVKQRVHRAILITGDSDFLPAIRAAKNEGVLIHLFHGTGPQQPHRDLWEEADDRTVITPDLLNTFLLSERPQQDRERPAGAHRAAGAPRARLRRAPGAHAAAHVHQPLQLRPRDLPQRPRLARGAPGGGRGRRAVDRGGCQAIISIGSSR
jgi:hypothetical protein